MYQYVYEYIYTYINISLYIYVYIALSDEEHIPPLQRPPFSRETSPTKQADINCKKHVSVQGHTHATISNTKNI